MDLRRGVGERDLSNPSESLGEENQGSVTGQQGPHFSSLSIDRMEYLWTSSDNELTLILNSPNLWIQW